MEGIQGWLVSTFSKAYLKLKKQPTLSVLTFHRVGDNLKITEEIVRHHLSYIADNYKAILPSELSEADSSSRLAIVTIDDGHKDVFESIYPIAKELGVPLVVCLPTDFFFRKAWLWFDQLYWLLSQAEKGTVLNYGRSNLIVGDEKSLTEFKQYIKTKVPEDREELLKSIASRLGCRTPSEPCEENRAVSMSELKEMISSGMVEIGGHTISHTIASCMPDEDLKRELTASKKEIEERLDTKVLSFCYPNGAKGDFDERTTNAVREAGYKMAFTTVEGINTLNNIDMYKIKRVHAHRFRSTFERNFSGLRWIFNNS